MTPPAQAPDAHRFEAVSQKVAPDGRLLRFWPLSGGSSANMVALEVAGADGQHRKLVVRRPSATSLARRPTAARDEFCLLQRLHGLGLATPEPYLLDESGQLFPAPYLVLEYLEGKPEFAPPDVGEFARQVAAHLAAIHRVAATGPEMPFLPRPPLDADYFAETFGPRPPHTARRLDDGRLRDALARHWPPPQHNASALLHGDPWPGNWLWRAGRLVALLDWEDAQAGDPLLDVAICRWELCWIVGPAAMHAFTRHYRALMPLDYRALPQWELHAALRMDRLVGEQLAEWVAFFPPLGRADITEQTLTERYRLFVAQAFERLQRYDEST